MNQEELIAKLKKALEKQPVRLAYLYGSYATGRTHPKSDIDVAVVLNPGSKKPEWHIAGEIQRELGSGTPEVDVRTIDLSTEPVFLANVLKPARSIFVKNEKERVGFEVAAWRRFYDTQHLRDIVYSHMYKRIKEDRYGRGIPNYQKVS